MAKDNKTSELILDNYSNHDKRTGVSQVFKLYVLRNAYQFETEFIFLVDAEKYDVITRKLIFQCEEGHKIFFFFPPIYV